MVIGLFTHHISWDSCIPDCFDQFCLKSFVSAYRNPKIYWLGGIQLRKKSDVIHPKIQDTSIWTIHDRPSEDLSDEFVARKLVLRCNRFMPTNVCLKSPHLSLLRVHFEKMGLGRYERLEQDEKTIIETWM